MYICVYVYVYNYIAIYDRLQDEAYGRPSDGALRKSTSFV